MPFEKDQSKNDEWAQFMAGIGKDVFTSEDIYITMRFSDLRIEEMFPATLSFGNSRMFLYTGIAQCQRMSEALTKYKKANYKVEEMSEDDRRLLPEGSVTENLVTTIDKSGEKKEEKNICRATFDQNYRGQRGLTILSDTPPIDALCECENPAELVIQITSGIERKTETKGIRGPRWEPQEVDDFLEKWEKYDMTKEPYDKANLPVILNELAPYNQNLMWWAMAWEPIQRAHYNLLYAVNSRTFKGFIELGKNLYDRAHEVAVGQHRRWPWSKGQKPEPEQ
jgi:hypothetical protein